MNKQILALSATRRYLESEELAKIHILQIYRELISQDLNLRAFSDVFPEVEIDLQKLAVSNSSRETSEFDTIANGIEKIRITMIFRWLDQDFPMFLPSLDRFFTKNQIKSNTYSTRFALPRSA